jgi:hypothetical protein
VASFTSESDAVELVDRHSASILVLAYILQTFHLLLCPLD